MVLLPALLQVIQQVIKREAVGWRSPRAERLPVSASTQGVCGGRVFQSGGDAEEGRAASLMLLFAEHEACQ
jgi:hypothetical protein